MALQSALCLKRSSSTILRRWVSLPASTAPFSSEAGPTTTAAAAATLPTLTVFSWGSSFQGVLGTGKVTDGYEPEPITTLPPDIVKIGAGHYCSFAITSQGELWSWGRNQEWNLGRLLTEQEGNFSSVPQSVHAGGLSKHHVMAATGSGVASFARTTDGLLFVFGTSKRGQLGLGSDHIQARKPTLVKGLPGKVVDMSAGWGHAAAVLEDGSLWTWGWVASGRLGHSFAGSLHEEEEEVLMQRCVWYPKRVEVLNGIKIIKVVCGMDHTLAVAQDGTCFSFGDNSLDQLGRRERPDGEHLHPKDASQLVIHAHTIDGKPAKFKRVTAGLGHNLAVLYDGSICSWGWNGASQLGLGASVTEECIDEPRIVYGVPEHKEAMIAAGRVHSVLVTDETGDRSMTKFKLYGRTWPHLSMCHTWGSSANGRLGLVDQEDAPAPELLTEITEIGELVLDVACGYDHTLVLLVT